MKMHSVPELIEDIRQGKMIILVDDEDRENEGDLVLAADHITPGAVNFMIKEARGLVCLTVTEEQASRLNLPLMVQDEFNFSPNKTSFTVSIEASQGVSTGISAADRAETIRVASNPQAQPNDVVSPGHIFPIRAQRGGVLKRAGHTEASVDMAKLAGLNPSAVVCEIINDDGTMARVPDLYRFAKKHDIKMGTIADLIKYRIENESLVTEAASCKLPSKFGTDFVLRVFKTSVDDSEHVVIQKGEITDDPTLVRVHSQCMTGDIFGSLRCDCRDQLRMSLEKIDQEGKGVLLYLRQEGRGIGLTNKIKAYALQEQGMDTVEANVHLGFRPDERDYGIGAQILRRLGVQKIRLMTNNPAKRVGLHAYGLEITERVPLVALRHPDSASYLSTKETKMGHLLQDLSAVISEALPSEHKEAPNKGELI